MTRRLRFPLVIVFLSFVAAGLIEAPPSGCNKHDPDADGDGVCNSADNCDFVPNPGQGNADGDGLGDVCDACTDTDGDGWGNTGYPANTCLPDNCPDQANPGQENADYDGLGDACDACTDTDEDGLGNPGHAANTCPGDNCPSIFNPDQEDGDLDGAGDLCDAWTICARDEYAPGFPRRQTFLPNPDYATPPPPRGATFDDGALGCSFKRLTHGLVETGRQVGHEYSTMSPFNSTSTRVIVDRGGTLGLSVMDLDGSFIRTGIGLEFGMQPRWSTTDPDRFYYHTLEDPPLPGNKVYAYDVATGTATLTATFAAYSSITFGGGKSDISPDGKHLVIDGERNDTPGVHEVFLLNVATGQTSTPILNPGGDCDVTPVTTNILCGGGAGLVLYKGFAGTYEGVDYASGALIRTVDPRTGHNDIGRDIDGEEVVVRIKYDATPDGCGVNPGIEKINVRTSQKDCILSLPYDSGGGPGGIHISINNVGGHPWALVSTYNSRWRGDRDFQLPVNPDCNYPACSLAGCRNFGHANADWRCLWGPYHNELLLLKLDGSQLHRLAHHRSRLEPDDPNQPNCACKWGCPSPPVCDASCSADGTDVIDDYFSTPRAALSRDARYVLFDSNFAEQPCLRYNDVYLMELLPPLPPTCGPCRRSFCTGADIGCEATGACGPNRCCHYDCGLFMPGCAVPECPPNVCGGCGGL